MPIKDLLSNCFIPLQPELQEASDLNMNAKSPKKQSALEGPGETVEFYDIIFEYIRNYNFPPDVRQKIDFNLLSSADVLEAKLKVFNMPVEYDADNNPDSISNGAGNTMKVAKKQVNNSILFSSVFVNSTSETQTHHLSTERRTNASCSLVMAKSMTREGELSIEVKPPGLMIQANGGFRKAVTLDSEKQKCTEEEISWALNTEIIVPAKCRTRADLVISEEQYDGRFRIDTIIEGSISVLTRDKKTNNIVSPVIISELQKIFKPKDGFYPVEGKPNAVRFVNEGHCSCQYGISQKVVLTEEHI